MALQLRTLIPNQFIYVFKSLAIGVVSDWSRLAGPDNVEDSNDPEGISNLASEKPNEIVKPDITYDHIATCAPLCKYNDVVDHTPAPEEDK